MTKKRSIVKLSIIAIFTLLGLFLTFFSFVIPTTNTTFKGFFNAINYGYDVDGGVLAVYKPFDEDLTGYDLEDKVTTTVAKLNSSLGDLGFYFTKQNDNIRVELSNVSYSELNSKYSTFGVDVFSLLNSSEGLTFSSSSSDGKAEGYVGGEYIDYCTYDFSSNANSWYITINFTQEGQTKFKTLTQDIADGEGDGKLYMFVDGSNYSSSGFEMTSGVSSLTLTATSQQAAEAMTIQISALARPMLLTQIVGDTINAGLNSTTGAFFGNIKTTLIFCCALILVATMVFLCIRYRVLGALACGAILIFIVVYSFLLQSIPLVLLDLNGIMGALIAYILLFAGIVSIFEKIRSEYAIGKKIPNSVNSGFKKHLIPVLEKYAYVLILLAVFFIVGTPALNGIAVSLFVGLFVNYFTLFAVLFGICRLYLPINSTNKALYNLKREVAKKDEI